MSSLKPSFWISTSSACSFVHGGEYFWPNRLPLKFRKWPSQTSRLPCLCVASFWQRTKNSVIPHFIGAPLFFISSSDDPVSRNSQCWFLEPRFVLRSFFLPIHGS